jgi:hypothetical protein
MKTFLLGVVVGAVGDRWLMQNASQPEILAEVREKLQRLDGILADMSKGANSESEVPTDPDPAPMPGDPTDPTPHAGDSAL